MTTHRIELPLFVNLRGVAKVTGATRAVRPFDIKLNHPPWMAGVVKSSGDVGFTVSYNMEYDTLNLRGLLLFEGGNLLPINPRAFDVLQIPQSGGSARAAGGNQFDIFQDKRRRPDTGFDLSQAQPKKDKLNIYMTVRM